MENGTEDYTACCYDSDPAGSGEKWNNANIWEGRKREREKERRCP